MRRHLSYANIAATLALIFATSGGALAATHYLINSTKQISPKVLRALKGNKGVRGAPGAPGANGANGSPGTPGKEGREGARGTTGAAGLEGKEGKEGKVKLGAIFEVDGSPIKVKAGEKAQAVADCSTGERAINGGFLVASETAGKEMHVSFERSAAEPGRHGWEFEVENAEGATEELEAKAVAYCAPEEEAIAASRVLPGSPGQLRRR